MPTGFSKKKEFLDVLLDISERDDNEFTTDDVREEVDTFLLGVSFRHNTSLICHNVYTSRKSRLEMTRLIDYLKSLPINIKKFYRKSSLFEV